MRQHCHRCGFWQNFTSMKKAVVISRTTIYSIRAGLYSIFPPMIRLFFFSDLPAVIHSCVIKLLAKPHPVIETLAERTWKLRTIWLFPYCSSMKISHLALFLVTRYSRWSNVLDRFRFNSVRHFRCFYLESDFVFQPVSESYDWILSGAFVQPATVNFQLAIRQLFHQQAVKSSIF